MIREDFVLHPLHPGLQLLPGPGDHTEVPAAVDTGDVVPADPNRPAAPATRLLLRAFGALTLLGFLALFVLAGHTDRFFAWTVAPPLTAAFYGAGYGAGFVLVTRSLREQSWARVRIAAITIFVFTALSLIATLQHLHRFHFMTGGTLAHTAATIWVTVYVVVPLALAAALAAEPHRGPPLPRAHPIPTWLRRLLGGQAAVLLVIGSALFLLRTRVADLWPWQLTSLTASMTGAWIVAFGVAVVLALVDGDLARLRTPALTYVVFAVLQLAAVAVYGGAVRWASVSAWAYLAMLVVMAGTGTVGWVLARTDRIGGRP